ncbi:helix-turn-helix domain-containing protein [Enterococcus faecalis]|uniref:helix-turn-helix domain-containing protein n=1 Tax=Enterococcus faecalis TaxID=1351 RepID=UPI0018C25D68|nr:helix-turn-helix transcriptional regulator [Enterococcus faecalis]MBG0302138.1 helix-turn-helix transcriptional regulator [Enterococcus faecalis]
MTVFERIKILAKNRSKTIKQVTLDLGYSENYFYSLKSGKQPSAEKLKEIADYFNVSVDYLLGRTENPNISSSKEDFSRLIKDEEENELLAAFRMESEDMTAEEKKKFNNSLKGMMKIAKGLLDDDTKWKD